VHNSTILFTTTVIKWLVHKLILVILIKLILIFEGKIHNLSPKICFLSRNMKSGGQWYLEENGPTIKVNKLYLTADEKTMEKTKDKIKLNRNNMAPRT